MKIVFLLYNAHAPQINLAPYAVQHISHAKWLAQRSNDDLSQYILNNNSPDALEPLINQYVYDEIQRRIALNTTPDYLLVHNFPLTPFQSEMLACVTFGQLHVILDFRSSEYIRVEELLTDDSRFQRLQIKTLPDRKLGTQFYHALPIDAAIVIQQTLRLSHSPRLKRQFVGSYPISLERRYIYSLQRFPYMVSLKIDGYRMFALAWRSRLWFVNRRMDVVEGPMCSNEFEGTLLDGEYVPQNNAFYVCDCLCQNGIYVGERPLRERLDATQKIGKALCKFLRPQKFVPLCELGQLWAERKLRSCKIDGVIFTSANQPYRLGIDYHMFKWKAEEDNTVDLLYYQEQLWCKSKGIQMTLRGNVEKTAISPLKENVIYECRPLKGKHLWEVLKERLDKPYPNLDWVVDNVLASIASNITIEELINLSK